MSRLKQAKEMSFDDVAEDLIGSHPMNLTHGDNSEVIVIPDAVKKAQALGKKMNDEWRQL
jgi:hypothetical protein